MTLLHHQRACEVKFGSGGRVQECMAFGWHYDGAKARDSIKAGGGG